jgi:hypothetical protein
MDEELQDMIFNLEFRLLILDEQLKELAINIEDLHARALRLKEQFAND